MTRSLPSLPCGQACWTSRSIKTACRTSPEKLASLYTCSENQRVLQYSNMKLHRKRSIKAIRSFKRADALTRASSCLPPDEGAAKLHDVPSTIISSLLCQWLSPESRLAVFRTSKTLAECLLSSEHVRLTLTADPCRGKQSAKGCSRPHLPRTIAWAAGLAGDRFKLVVQTPATQETPRLLCRLLGQELTLDRVFNSIQLGALPLADLRQLDLKVSVPFPGNGSPWLSHHQLASTCPNLTHLTLLTWGANPDPLRMAYHLSQLESLEIEVDTKHSVTRHSSGAYGSGPNSSSALSSAPCSGPLSSVGLSTTTSTTSTTLSASSASSLNMSDSGTSGSSLSAAMAAVTLTDGNYASLATVARLPKLTALTLRGEWPAFTVVAPLAHQLTNLEVSQEYTGCGEDFITEIAACTQLKRLALLTNSGQAAAHHYSTQSSASAVQQLVPGAFKSWAGCLASLTSIRLEGHQMTDSDLRSLLSYPSLKGITVHSLRLLSSHSAAPCSWETLHIHSTDGLWESAPGTLGPSLARLPGGSAPPSTVDIGVGSSPSTSTSSATSHTHTHTPLRVQFTQRLTLVSGTRERGSLRSQLQQATQNITQAPGGRCVLPGIAFDGKPFNWGEAPPYHLHMASYLEGLLGHITPRSDELELALMPVGDATLSTLARCCGRGDQRKALQGLLLAYCTLDESFWRQDVGAVLPGLQWLRLRLRGQWDMAVDLPHAVAFCMRQRSVLQVTFEFDQNSNQVGPSPAAQLAASLEAKAPCVDVERVGMGKVRVNLPCTVDW